MLAQLIRFGLVGGLATLTHVLVAITVRALFQAPPQAANLVGFAAAVVLSYLGHARFTFGVDTQSGAQAWRFVMLSGLSLLLSSGAVWMITDRLGYPFPLAMAAVTVLVPVGSYVAMRFWVFAEGKKAPP